MTDPKTFIARWSRRKLATGEEAQTQAPCVSSQQQRRSTSPCKGEVGDPGFEPGEPGGGLALPFRDSKDPHPTASLRSAVDLPLSGRGITESAEQLTDPVVDLTKLPPIESITAATDIQPFLARGVPSELTRAALRRAWAADPTIRDFIGLAENAWDFNAPDAMGGFGPLELTDELRREIAAMVGRGLAREAPVPTPSATDPHPTARSSARAADLPLPGGGITESVAPAEPGSSEDALAEGARQRDSATPDCAPQAPQRRHGGALPQ